LGKLSPCVEVRLDASTVVQLRGHQIKNALYAAYKMHRAQLDSEVLHSIGLHDFIQHYAKTNLSPLVSTGISAGDQSPPFS